MSTLSRVVRGSHTPHRAYVDTAISGTLRCDTLRCKSLRENEYALSADRVGHTGLMLTPQYNIWHPMVRHPTVQILA